MTHARVHRILAQLRCLPVLAIVAACGGSVQQRQSSLLPKNAPPWVARGSGAFKDGGQAFYGVGAVASIKSVGLARDASGARARNDLAKTIEVFIRSLYKDYQSSIADVGTRAGSDQQLVEQAIKEYTEATLSGVRIVEYWADDQAGTLYSLAKLDFEAAQKQFDRLGQLNEQARQYIRQNASRAFDELDRAGQRPPRQ